MPRQQQVLSLRARRAARSVDRAAVLRSLIDGLAGTAGHDFFERMVKRLTRALNVHYAFVAEVPDPSVDFSQTIAVASSGRRAANFGYALSGTPCENVVRQQTRCYPADVQKLFPDDLVARRLRVEGYAGTPLFASSGQVIGLLAVAHREPIRDEETVVAALEAFAARASAELERRHVVSALEASEAQFHAHFMNLPDPSFIWRRVGGDFALMDANPAAFQFSDGLVAEVMGKKASEYYRDRRHICDDLDRCWRTGTAFQRELPYRLRSGHTRQVRATYVPMPPASVIVHVQDITDAVLAAETLRGSELKYRTLVEETRHGITIFANGRIVFANRAMGEMLGYEVAELTALTPSAVAGLLHPDDRDEVTERAADRLAGQVRPVINEYRAIRKDGSAVWLETRVSGITFDGRPALLSVATDVTERRRTEDLLRFQADVLRGVRDSVIATDLEGGIVYWNEGAAALFGYSTDETVGLPIGMLYSDQRAADRAACLEPVRRGGEWAGVFEARARSGDTLWVEARTTLLRDSRGRPVGFLEVARDVTEQRRAEQALRRTDEKYRDILRHMDEVVYVLAPAGDTWRDVRLELVSGSLERLLGYTPQEFQADPDLFFRVMHHGDRADARLAMRAAVRGGKPGAREFRLRHKHTGAYHWFEDRMIPQRDGTGTVVSVLGVARDVTARKAVDRALRASRLRLRRLSRRLLEVQEEERGRIARELHDEVGQGLTAVKMHVAALSRCPAERERRAAECAELIEQSIQLVRSLSVELRPPTLDELGLAAALTTLARRQAELAGLVLELDVPPLAHRPSPDVEQACFRIAQEACTNVLRHARASRLGIALREERRALVLTVWDDGVGIRSADKGRRQGVGLAGMRERAQLAGGTLGIRSQAGRTTVRARFPHPHP